MEGRAKTALVLSAGGMYGAYQAGVWQELAGVFRPDLVVGASIGSLNGWFIAGECPATQIVERWRNLHDASDHRFQIPPFLSDGIIQNNGVEKWIRDVYAAVKPRCAYALVTTEMASLRPSVFSWPGLEWSHLAASCAVPLFLKQQRIEGKLHGDGGLVEPLPLWAAMQLGARRIVAVNVLVNRPLVVRAAARLAAICGKYRPPDMENIELVSIEPTRSLGSLKAAMYWSQANAERMIELGREDARSAIVHCPWLGGPEVPGKVALFSENI